MQEAWFIGAAFAGYLLAMLVIGLWAWRRTRTMGDYLLGGRSLGAPVAALSAGASDMSGWLLLGLPGLTYGSGLQSIWLAAGLLAGTWLNWRLMAGRLRRYSLLADDALTIPEFLAARFGDPRLLRVTAAALILFFFLLYTSSGLVAGGKLFETVFGLPYHWAVLTGGGTVLLYTLFGGFLAVSWTDVVQGLLMAMALLVVPLMTLEQAGGAVVLARLQEEHSALLHPLLTAQGEPLGAIALLSLAGWGLGYFGQPHILARFQAIREVGRVTSARRIAVTWTALTLGGAILVGLAGLGHPELAGLADPERVFIHLVRLLFHPVMAGICLAAILAAIMSTADSQLLVCASSLSEDLYRGLLRPRAGERELVLVGRLAVFLVALLAGSLALTPDAAVLQLVGYAWAGLGASFGPVLLISLYWGRATRRGVLAGMVTGAVTVVLWHHLEGGLFDLYELIPAFLLGGLATLLGSLMDQPPPTGVMERHARLRGAGTG